LLRLLCALSGEDFKQRFHALSSVFKGFCVFCRDATGRANALRDVDHASGVQHQTAANGVELLHLGDAGRTQLGDGFVACRFARGAVKVASGAQFSHRCLPPAEEGRPVIEQRIQ
jgi:hypothetical protein